MEHGKRFWNSNRRLLWRTHLASANRPHLGMTACRAGVVGYPSGCASGCAAGWATECGAGCPSGSLSNFFESCGPNKENASSSIACIRRRVSFISISDSSLEALETDSDLSRFLSRSWNVTQHLSATIDSWLFSASSGYENCANRSNWFTHYWNISIFGVRSWS